MIFMKQTSPAEKVAAFIQKRFHGTPPVMGLVLGSGLGIVAEHIQEAVCFPYSELPDFPQSSVKGHSGQLILGKLGGLPIACLQGRIHFYEGFSNLHMKTFIRTLKYLGCKSVFLTNAAGSLNPSMGPGQLMLIRDHLNFQGTNPLIGPNEDKEGPRFLPMENTYDAELSNLLKSTAHQLEIPLEEGVYLAVTGPCYETLAEVKAFHLLGADAVGMSTVPEAIVAHHCGLKVMGLSVITNSAAGLHPNSLSHEETLATAQKTAHKVCQLLEVFFKTLASEPPLFK